MNGMESGGREHLDRGTVRNIGRSCALGQHNLRSLWHQIVLNWRILARLRLRTLCPGGRDEEDCEQAIAQGEAAAEKRDPGLRKENVAKRRASRGALPAHLPRIEVT